MYRDGIRDQFPLRTKNKKEIDDMKRKYDMKICDIRVKFLKSAINKKFKNIKRKLGKSQNETMKMNVEKLERKYNKLSNQPASPEVMNALNDLSKEFDQVTIQKQQPK